MLGPGLLYFSIFTDGTGCTLCKSADYTKLGGVADRPDGCVVIQRDLDRMRDLKEIHK